MIKKGILTICITIIILTIVTPYSFSYADKIEHDFNLNIDLTLDETLVELPIEDLKAKDITIFKNEKGRYVVFVPMEDGQYKMQVVSPEEVKVLGYVEDITNNLPHNKNVIIEQDSQHGYIVRIIDGNGYEIKQVISKEEALKLGFIENVANLPKDHQYQIEKDENGNYFIYLINQDGKRVKQSISEEEAKLLGYNESKLIEDKIEDLLGSHQSDKTSSKESVNKSSVLPKTATAFYNYLLVGGLFLGLGVIFLIRYKKTNF